MKPNPLSLAAALLLAACATEVRDETPGRAEALSPIRTQTYTPSAGNGAELKTLRQVQAEANGRAAPQTPPRQRRAEADPQPPRPSQPAPQRRRGSSSPPPGPIDMPTPGPLPTAPSTEAMTDRFKRDLMSPEVDRLRQEDALGRLDPIQQRDLFRREQDLRQYGTGPLGR